MLVANFGAPKFRFPLEARIISCDVKPKTGSRHGERVGKGLNWIYSVRTDWYPTHLVSNPFTWASYTNPKRP
jgi:hypothetical protein